MKHLLNFQNLKLTVAQRSVNLFCSLVGYYGGTFLLKFSVQERLRMGMYTNYFQDLELRSNRTRFLKSKFLGLIPAVKLFENYFVVLWGIRGTFPSEMFKRDSERVNLKRIFKRFRTNLYNISVLGVILVDDSTNYTKN